MHNNKAEFIESNENALRSRLMGRPQLTPTGKISHAKTRVYTQRYRKAWEQMPDFKGWLTSVPHQPTRAFCTYCKKNLHAHRLSLLKHTCTMKHQRGALMHQREASALTSDIKTSEVDDEMHDEPDEIVRIETHNFKLEQEDVEDEDEEIEYVVERLDCDMENEQSKDLDEDEDQHYVEEEEEHVPIAKKAKTDSGQESNTHSQPDALAEAMAHVHHEYLDENGDSVNVELEMVVESADPSDQEMRIVSVRSEREEEEVDQITIENYDNDDNSNDYNTNDHEKENDHDHTGTADSSYRSSMGGESSDVVYSETEEPSASSRKGYLTKPSTARSISVLPSGNNGSGVLTPKKTITITSGGKTVTLDGASLTSFAGGSRFVINSKNQIQFSNSEKGLQGMRNDSAGTVKTDEIQPQIVAVAQNTNSYSVPGTSQQNPKKHIILKPVKPLVAKKPCISTHVLDTSKGLPVGGLQISLYKLMDGRWTFLNESNTTPDGRCADLVDTSKYTFTAGRYKLHFDVDKYFTLRRIETMYPFIEIIFDVKNPLEHYHIPVLISPFGYTTYRGT